MKASLCKKLSFCALILFPWQLTNAQLDPELIPSIEVMPDTYPDSVIFAHDANFDALIAGRIVLVDVASDNKNYLGALDASQFASFIQSANRDELYVAETFYTRGTRGKRQDVISIYDKKNIKIIDEIILPGSKRGLVVTNKYTLQLIDNDKYLMVYNFTPAASVTMIDIASRTILSNTDIPGCALVYPSGKRGFSSLCSNGSIYSAQFDQQGKLLEQSRSEPVFNIEQDPLFDKPIYHQKTAYYPSFLGSVLPINFSAAKPQVGKSWSLLTDQERKENWRPGGWQIAAGDDQGKLYMLMHKDGSDGSHKSGGPEIWIYDLKSQKRIQKIVLKTWGVSVEVTRGANPYMVVTNANMQLDVYHAENGEWIKEIGGTAAMPFILHAMRK